MKRTRFTRVLKVEPLRLAVAIGVVLWAWGVPILAAQEAAGKPSEVQNEAGEAAASADAENSEEAKKATANSSGPLEPAEALKRFKVTRGVRIELVASEPQIVDPVAMRFDAQGRLWVVEMRDYPHGPAAGEKPLSRIKWLEDRDGDGFYETAEIFADGLLFATGIQPWKEGLIVTLAGQVAFLADTDGDGRADQQETWYRGFAEENSQLRANHPYFGLDQHIYVANGLRGGQAVDVRRPGAEPVALSGKDFRFHPNTGAYEAVGGAGQFGLTFDDYGNRFICSNRNPLKQIVLEDQYLRRNSNYAPTATAHDVAAAGEASRIFPISQFWTTSNLHAGQFTAACGVIIYRGNALPKIYYGNGFTCDPTGNLVHRERISPQGAVFQGRPAEDGVEFLASTDTWFRPVNLSHGPDGALYVVDMYRAVIEHPQFMPDELKNRPDLLDGTDRGRIYRLTARTIRDPDEAGPNSSSSAENVPSAASQAGADQRADQVAAPRVVQRDLAKIPVAQLVAYLEHPNAWQRETAARLLFERQDPSAVEPLRRIALDGRLPAARVQALWTLQGLGALTRDLIELALQDAEPAVRGQAVRLSEQLPELADVLRPKVALLASDEDPQVRFQVALSLTPVVAAAEVPVLREIAVAGMQDEWTQRAVALAASEQSSSLLLSLLKSPPWKGRALRGTDLSLLDELLPAAIAEPTVRGNLLQALVQAEAADDTARLRSHTLLTFVQALARRRTDLASVLKQADPETRDAVAQVWTGARQAVLDPQLAFDAKRPAIELLAYDAESRPTLLQLLAQTTDTSLLTLTIRALARSEGEEPWTELLERFPAESPTVRLAILDAMLSRPQRTQLLLDAIERGGIKPSEIDRTPLNRLLQHGDAAIRERATRALASAIPADRQQVLADYQPVLQLAGDAPRGREVFRRNCATCHRVGELGVNVAPDISDSRTKQPAQLLADILQPNRAIDNNYISYTVATSDGQLLTGVIANETSTSVTLRQPEGKETTLLRSQIEEMRSNGISLMPDGLEKNIPHQEMADLLSFIKNWRYLDGRVPVGISK
jgi:putative membrane-bound dehydrogenase-like protein